MLAYLGGYLGILGAMLAHLVAMLGLGWPILGAVGPSWRYLGPSWGLCWLMLAQHPPTTQTKHPGAARISRAMLGHVDQS